MPDWSIFDFSLKDFQDSVTPINEPKDSTKIVCKIVGRASFRSGD
jgi:hypothetical protein